MYKITQINGIKAYNMSAGKTLPQFLQEVKKSHRSLRYNQDFRKRIQLIQDFHFQIATNQISISNDQRYIVAVGIYGPQIKIFDTAQLSLKCLRGLDSQVVKFKILSEDYSKIVMVEHDRSIDFHTQYGSHYKTRIPHFPRDVEYNPINANLCISASAQQVYRMSLEEGKFLTSFHTDSMINSLSFNDKLNILACGGEGGVEIWDFRQRNKICNLEIDSNRQVTYIKCDPSGLLMGVGSKGQTDFYDFRFDRKLYKIKSSYNEPINSISFTQDIHKSILISNKKQIKITQNEGQFFTSIQPDANINMFTIAKGSGMIFSALDDPKIGCYFIPQLGSAPRWVPYIQNITQELEQSQKTMVYDQYKFVTKHDVFELGCTNLIGTKILKEYMHGYLMHLKLYIKLKQKLEMINYGQARKKKIEEEVLQNVPVRIESKEIVSDERFEKMKDNPQFRIDRYSESFILRHPHLKKQLLKEKQEQSQKLERMLRIGKKKQIQKTVKNKMNRYPKKEFNKI